MQFALVGTHLVNSDSMLCAAATPHAGPAPAPPPGPAPSPPPSTVATLQQIEVETLALNQPYSPMPYEAYIQPTSLGPDAISPTGPDPRYKGDGKLHIELEYEYSDEVRWGFEPTEYAGESFTGHNVHFLVYQSLACFTDLLTILTMQAHPSRPFRRCSTHRSQRPCRQRRPVATFIAVSAVLFKLMNSASKVMNFVCLK